MKKIERDLPFRAHHHGKMEYSYAHMNVKQLFAEYDKKLTEFDAYREDPNNTKWDWSLVDPLRRAIATRLGFALVEDINTVVTNVINDVVTELNEITTKQNENFTKFKEHRHNTDKRYSEKPVW